MIDGKPMDEELEEMFRQFVGEVDDAAHLLLESGLQKSLDKHGVEMATYGTICASATTVAIAGIPRDLFLKLCGLYYDHVAAKVAMDMN